MPKIGKEYVRVKDFSICLVVYIKEQTNLTQGNILVKHNELGREWLTPEQLENDFVER